jgi:hypothetical protein
MRNVTVAVLAALGLCGMAAPALAKITQYECRFAYEKARGGGWIPEIVVVTDNEATGEIIAFDPLIRHFVGNPIAARRSSQSAARVTYVWTLDARNKGQSSRMTYTLSYFANGQPARMRAQPGGYDNTWSGDGSCKLSRR